MSLKSVAAVVLLLLIVSACNLNPGPGTEQQDPPVEQPADPDPTNPDPPEPGPEVPGTAGVTVVFPEDLTGLPVTVDGSSGVQRLLVSYWPAAAADAPTVTALALPPEAVTVELVPGAPLQLELAAGSYEFELVGYGADTGVPLAWARTTASVTDTAFELNFNLQAVIGGVDITTVPPRSRFQPGEVLTFQLSARAAVDGLLVPLAALDVVYDIVSGSGQLLSAGPDGVTLRVTDGEPLEISALVRGISLVDGELNFGGTVGASNSLQAEPATPVGADWQVPVITFNPIDQSAGVLTGTVSDDRGIQRVVVRHGATVIGSSDPGDQSEGAAPVTFTGDDAGTWVLEWTVPPGTSHFRATATDLTGNSNSAFRSVNVTPPADPAELTGYMTLRAASGEQQVPDNFDAALGHCAANEFQIPGQGLQAVGAGLQAVGAGLQAVGALGGLFLADTGSFEGALMWGRDAMDALDPVTARTAAWVPAPVVIMVVDDFGEAGNEMIEWPTLHATMESLSQVMADGKLPHGVMVAEHIQQLLANGLGYTRTETGPEPTFATRRYYRSPNSTWDEPDIVLQFLNINGMSGSEIPATMHEQIAAWSETAVQAEQVSRFVLNMSFVLLPCDVTEDMQASGLGSFEDYVNAVAAVNNVSEDQAGIALTGAPADDPMARFFECPFGDPGDCKASAAEAHMLVPVASSGNFGLDFTLYPAAYEQVIAVGSLDVLADGEYGTSRAAYSNPGNVLAPGGMFRLVQTGDMTIGYAGTSFAAPYVAAFMAHDIGLERRCHPQDASVTPDGLLQPLLAGAQLQDVPLYSGFGNGGSALDVVCPLVSH